jgi:hypothetical protein
VSFPIVQTTSAGTQTTNSFSWTLTYPSGVVIGDLLLCFVGSDGGAGYNYTLAAEWTRILHANNAAAILVVWYRIADGSESGTFTMSITGPAGEQGAWRVVRISNWDGRRAPEITSAATGTSTNPDPPSLTPSWGLADTLWFAIEAADDGRTDATAWPLPDGNFNDSSGGATGAHLGTCRDELMQASLDPGTFTIDRNEEWLAATLAVPPVLSIPWYASGQLPTVPGAHVREVVDY